MPRVAEPSRSRASRTIAGFAHPPSFSSAACSPANAVSLGDHVPTSSGTCARAAARTRRPRPARARTARPRTRSRRPRAAGARPPTPRAIAVDRPPLLDAEPAEPRAGGEPEERAPAGREVERGRLTGHLHRMHRERVEADGPTRTRSVAARDLEQRRERRLVPEIVEHRHHLEAAGLRRAASAAYSPAACRSAGRARARAAHVSSDVGMRAPPDALDPHDQRSSGSGHATKCPARASRRRQRTLLRRQERQHRLSA